MFTRRGFIKVGAAVVALVGTFRGGRATFVKSPDPSGAFFGDPAGLCRIWVELDGHVMETVLLDRVPTHADREERMRWLADKYVLGRGRIEIKERITFPKDGVVVEGSWRP